MKVLLKILIVVLSVYIVICGTIYFFQEKLIFFPSKLDDAFVFDSSIRFEEVRIKAEDGVVLHGLLFKTESPKGVIFYLHGNAGSLQSWSRVAPVYTNLCYDVFIIDYRGYGKSEGEISSQEQLYKDVQLMYNEVLKRYKENEVIVIGYSIGSGPAAWLASQNNPAKLILQAPYYSLTDMMRNNYLFLPVFILKYPFPTYEYLVKCKMPVVLFHGDRDQVIYYGSSQKLSKLLKPGDQFITLEGQTHNGMTFTTEYLQKLNALLE